MTTGDRIKYLRNKEHLNQVELAKRVGVSKQTLYKYENGIITNIPSDKIETIAKTLNTTPAFLMGWDNTIPVSHMDKISNVISIAKKSGIDVGEIIGCPGLLPEDYEGNLRVHEVKKKYEKRLGIIKNKEGIDLGKTWGPALFSNSEKQLIDLFRQLNTEGQQKAQAYLEDLAGLRKYTEPSIKESFA